MAWRAKARTAAVGLLAMSAPLASGACSGSGLPSGATTKTTTPPASAKPQTGSTVHPSGPTTVPSTAHPTGPTAPAPTVHPVTPTAAPPTVHPPPS